MPKYMTAKDIIEEGETLTAALAIVRTTGLELDRNIPILPPQFARYLIAPEAFLLVVPSTANDGSDRYSVANAMALSKCDAIIVCVSRPHHGPNKVVIDVGIDGLVPVWYTEYRPCLLDGVLHLAPDHDASKPTFRLTKRGLKRSIEFDALGSNEPEFH